VVLLGRAASGETPRAKPWCSWRPAATGTLGAAAYHSVAVGSRYSARRLVRLCLLGLADALVLDLTGGRRAVLPDGDDASMI
jgi:hypothetical protein